MVITTALNLKNYCYTIVMKLICRHLEFASVPPQQIWWCQNRTANFNQFYFTPDSFTWDIPFTFKLQNFSRRPKSDQDKRWNIIYMYIQSSKPLTFSTFHPFSSLNINTKTLKCDFYTMAYVFALLIRFLNINNLKHALILSGTSLYYTSVKIMSSSV